MVQRHHFPDLTFRDSSIPGGTLVNALWHRDVMRLSDRGRASELVGDRWAEICAEVLGLSIGTERQQRSESGEVTYRIEGIARLDDVPAIASIASRNKLQNPDFLVLGSRDGASILQPADAKFSIETAKAKQVSADVAASLLALGPVVTEHIPGLGPASDVIDGFFLCPDFSLTHYMLQRRTGSRGSVTVFEDQVDLLPVTAAGFMEPIAGRDLALWLAKRDGFPVDPRESLLAFLYYFRLARACVGCWVDMTAPLLAYRDTPVIDLDAVGEVVRSLESRGGSAWDLVLALDTKAELIRRQRSAVDHATSLPLTSSELRQRIERVAKAEGLVPPSISKVRRTVGSWFRSRLRDQYGAILPPVENLPSLLRDLAGATQRMRPDLLEEIDQTVVRYADVVDTLTQPAAH